MPRSDYEDQVRLLVRVLPFVAHERGFALKGGTAINLFHRDMPRLSVDIDLTYLPINDRDSSLADIDTSLNRIMTAINNGRSGFSARRISGGGGGETRVQVQSSTARIKIETSPVARGTVLPPASMIVTKAVEEEFGFAEIQVVSFEDLFGGKLSAALDRQHPRDLFDVKLLYENEGLTDDLFRVFLVYIVSSSRPAHELLNPHLKDITGMYETEFAGMASQPIEQKELEITRLRMLKDVQVRLEGPSADFLRSFHAVTPNFRLVGLPNAASLPAVQWKLLNLEHLRESNPVKFAEQAAALEALLQ